MELIVLMVALAAMMWWMSSRNKKAQSAAAAFRDNLTVGQEVMTGSGLFGTIVDVEDERITLVSGTGPRASQSVWLRQAIAKVVEPPVVDDAEGAATSADGDADTDGPADGKTV